MVEGITTGSVIVTGELTAATCGVVGLSTT